MFKVFGLEVNILIKLDNVELKVWILYLFFLWFIFSIEKVNSGFFFEFILSFLENKVLMFLNVFCLMVWKSLKFSISDEEFELMFWKVLIVWGSEW